VPEQVADGRDRRSLALQLDGEGVSESVSVILDSDLLRESRKQVTDVARLDLLVSQGAEDRGAAH
jgi:hypothetical protein